MRPPIVSPLLLFLSTGVLASPGRLATHQPYINCPIIFDGRVPANASLLDFDNDSSSRFSTKYVKGENLTWSSIIQWPLPSHPSRFDIPGLHKPFQVTVNDHSLFRSGAGLQIGFRRAGLLLKDDANAEGADQADKGIVTFHWSVMQDETKGLNLTHEYMNVWHERADYAGNQWTFSMGLLLPVDGGDGIDTPEKRKSFKVQDSKNKIIFETPIEWTGWQNFAIQLDYIKSTIQVFYSKASDSLTAVTGALANNNTGGGQMQLGLAKKPTETETVVWDGYQESIQGKEGQTYGSIFVEDSSGGCISF